MFIYIVCPVRDGTPEEVLTYVSELEKEGHVCHLPPRDVDQSCPTGVNICNAHLEAMKKSDEVHIFWDVNSKGSHFDFGMAYALGRKIKLVKAYQPDTEGKSYLKVLKHLSS